MCYALLQGVAIEVTDELSGERMSQALGRIILMMQEQFSAQPSREKSFAVAIGRDFVDTVVATKSDTGIVTYRHSKKHMLSLNRESMGLQHLVAAVIAPAEASGYISMDPPAHTPTTCMYVGPYVPLRYLVNTQTSTMPSCGTQVYQVNIKKRKRRTSKAAILKICSPWLVAREVRFAGFFITLLGKCAEKIKAY